MEQAGHRATPQYRESGSMSSRSVVLPGFCHSGKRRKEASGSYSSTVALWIRSFPSVQLYLSPTLSVPPSLSFLTKEPVFTFFSYDVISCFSQPSHLGEPSVRNKASSQSTWHILDLSFFLVKQGCRGNVKTLS